MEFAPSRDSVSVSSNSVVVRSTSRQSAAASPSVADVSYRSENPLSHVPGSVAVSKLKRLVLSRGSWHHRAPEGAVFAPHGHLHRGIFLGIQYLSRFYLRYRGHPDFSPGTLKGNRAATRSRRYKQVGESGS